ncbi:MAG TPA: small multi-drug export protein, partial [Dehalococcoidia bacterium]|nr:small multi-drug export protein [Dehalococcoidia bacterium]
PSYIQRVRDRGRPLVSKHGFLGLALFVAVPLPFTGVYSGTILSWLMGMDLKKSSLAIGLGALALIAWWFLHRLRGLAKKGS